MITREEALALVHENIKKPNLVKHVLAVEAIMRELAGKFEEDVDLWGIAGLLHDLDYEYTADKPEEHGYRTLEMLKGKDVPDEVLHAILAHVGHVNRDTLIDKAIYSVDPITGLIVASALMHPTKSLAGMDATFVGKRFKEKRFAAGANREAIASCKEMGLDLQDFIEISLEAMRKISDELGL